MRESGLYNLFLHYKKYWRVILICSIIGFLFGLVYNSFIQTPKYKSNATLIIVKNDEANSGKNSTLINNYIRLFKSRKVLEPTIRDLDLKTTYNELIGSIEAVNDTDTEVVKLSVSSKNPDTSKEILNHSIDIFKKEAKSLYKKDNIQIVDSASHEGQPYNVNAFAQLAISTAIGLLIPSVIIFFIYDIRFNADKPESKEHSSNNLNNPPEPAVEKIIESQNTQNYNTVKSEAPLKKQGETKPVSIIRSLNVPDRRR